MIKAESFFNDRNLSEGKDFRVGRIIFADYFAVFDVNVVRCKVFVVVNGITVCRLFWAFAS